MHPEVIIINLLLAILFFLVTLLVIRKSRNVVNVAFAVTTGLFSISSLNGLISELMTDNIIPQLFPEFIGISGDFVFLVAPLGVLYSSYMVIYGYEAWKNKSILILTAIYIVVEIILALNGNNNSTLPVITFEYFDNIAITRGLFNLLIAIPLLLSVYYFGRLYTRMKGNKNSILLLEIAIGTGTLGQILNSIFIIIGQGTQVWALLIIVVGVFLAALSFSNIFASKKV